MASTNLYMLPLSVLIQYLTNVGVIAAGASVTTQLAGSVSTLQTTYSDSSGLVPNPNPLILNSAARPANSQSGALVAFWVTTGVAVDVYFTDTLGETWSIKNMAGINDPSGASSLLSLLASPANSNASGAGPAGGVDFVANAMKSYDVFADVRAANAPVLASGQTLSIQVQGGAAINDGAGGNFYWSTSSTATDNGTNVLKPNSIASGSPGRWLRLFTPPFGDLQTLVSAATTDLGTMGSNFIQLTGAAAITSFGSSANIASPVYLIYFNGAMTLTFSGTLQTPGGNNILTAAGDFAIVQYFGSGSWIVMSYQRASSSPPGDLYLSTLVDQPTTSNIIQVNITNLSFTLQPGTYRAKLLLMMLGTGGTGQGYQFELAFSGTLTGLSAGAGVASANLTASAVVNNLNALKSIAAISDTAGSPDVVNVDYAFVVSVAGVLNAQFCQASSNANATVVKAGSQLIITRVA